MGNAGSDIITLATSLTIVTSSFFVTHSVTNGTRPSLSEAHNMFKAGTSCTSCTSCTKSVQGALHVAHPGARSVVEGNLEIQKSCKAVESGGLPTLQPL